MGLIVILKYNVIFLIATNQPCFTMKFYLMLFSIALLSCNQNNPATVNSAGEWVPTGDSFSLGQSEDVDLIKGMMADFNNLDLEGVQNRWGDTITFYPYNMKEPIIMANEDLGLWMGQFDSVQTTPLKFLPISNKGQGVRIVHTIQNENRFYKDGSIEKLHLYNIWFINDQNKVTTLRQFGADWGNN